jgi:hypothetical protein
MIFLLSRPAAHPALPFHLQFLLNHAQDVTLMRLYIAEL